MKTKLGFIVMTATNFIVNGSRNSGETVVDVSWKKYFQENMHKEKII